MKPLWWLVLAQGVRGGALSGIQLRRSADPLYGARAREPSLAQVAHEQAIEQSILNPTSSSTSGHEAVSPGLFAVLEESARLTDIAYCVGPASDISSPFSCPSRCSDFPTFELITTFSPLTPLPLIDESATGYLAYDHDPRQPRLVLAFRGTYSIADAIADLGTIPQPYKPYPIDEPSPTPTPTAVAAAAATTSLQSPIPAASCDNCTVHSGFYLSYLATRKALLPAILEAHKKHPDYRIEVSGHSLGGAIALLSALELGARGLATTLTTFGAPRVGNEAFAHHASQQLGGNVTETLLDGTTVELPRMRRMTHQGDPVPGLPWAQWGYVQPAGELRINKQTLPVTRSDVIFCSSECPDDDTKTTTERERKDSRRIAGLPPMPWTLVAAHRDYIHRLGLCVGQ